MNAMLLALSLLFACGPDENDTSNVGDTDPTEEDTEDTEDTEDPGPTTGPGVLGDETGLEASCRRFFECGGTYYADQDACMEASYNYWGDCPEVKNALDDLGACVAEVDCDEYNPNSYQPASIGCGDEWSDLGEAECN